MGETQIAAAVHEWLFDTGFGEWTITVEHGDQVGWVIRLDHPASAGLVFETARHEPDEAILVAVELLAGSDELRVASSAPSLDHRDVVAGVRALTLAFDWSRTEVRAVARLFEEHGLLTESETDWLSHWTGRTMNDTNDVERCRFCGTPVSAQDVEQGLAVQRGSDVAHHGCVFVVEETGPGPHGWAVLDLEGFSDTRARGPISGA